LTLRLVAHHVRQILNVKLIALMAGVEAAVRIDSIGPFAAAASQSPAGREDRAIAASISPVLSHQSSYRPLSQRPEKNKRRIRVCDGH
jgi:hypothetical protein